MSEDDTSLRFSPVVRCDNPMEVEIFPAALREAEIPHRTEWNEGGALTILVADDWRQEAEEALARARKIFFGQTEDDSGHVQPDVAPTGNQATAEQSRRKLDADPDGKKPPEEDEEELEQGGMFMVDALPSPDETRIRTVWPAWVLAAIPGLGLGHLYAGKFQMFFYLFFASMLGVLFYHFTLSLWSILLPLFAWAVDLGFAAYQVKDHNRRARRAQRRLEESEQRFLESL